MAPIVIYTEVEMKKQTKGINPIKLAMQQGYESAVNLKGADKVQVSICTRIDLDDYTDPAEG